MWFSLDQVDGRYSPPLRIRAGMFGDLDQRYLRRFEELGEIFYRNVSVGENVVKSYGCDAAGRTTTVVSPAGTTNLAYDFVSRATGIEGPGVSQTNVDNGLDTRVGSTTNAVSRPFLRDGAYVTDPVLADGAATYTPGVAKRRAAATTSLPGLKNVDAQRGTAQTVAASRQYDAFGNLVSSTGTWNGPLSYGGGLGYQEDAAGLKLLGHRYYDSSTERFLTRDPVMDGKNWYAYCEHSPIESADPGGLMRVSLLIEMAQPRYKVTLRDMKVVNPVYPTGHAWVDVRDRHTGGHHTYGNFQDGRRLDPKYGRDRLRELCLEAKVPVISPHKARHTAATLALGATGDLHAVQKMLGHAQISLTANLYGHGTAEAQKRVANALEQLMVPKEPREDRHA